MVQFLVRLHKRTFRKKILITLVRTWQKSHFGTHNIFACHHIGNRLFLFFYKNTLVTNSSPAHIGTSFLFIPSDWYNSCYHPCTVVHATFWALLFLCSLPVSILIFLGDTRHIGRLTSLHIGKKVFWYTHHGTFLSLQWKKIPSHW